MWQDYPTRRARTADLVLLVGCRKHGKSTLARAIVGHYERTRDVVVIYDQHHDEAYDAFAYTTAEAVRKERKLPRVLRLGPPAGDSWPTVADLVQDLALAGLHVAVVVDELDTIAPGGRGASWPAEASHLAAWTNYGRHIGAGTVDVVGGCRRPQGVHPDFAEQATHIYLLRVSGRNALRWVEEACGEQWARRAAELPRWKYIAWSPDQHQPPTEGTDTRRVRHKES